MHALMGTLMTAVKQVAAMMLHMLLEGDLNAQAELAASHSQASPKKFPTLIPISGAVQLPSST
jgi:hypothetical protein